MNQNKKIAIIGGTGKAGSFVVNSLHDKGFRVRALVRDPWKIEPVKPGLEIIEGNILNYEPVHSLLEGCDVLISTLGQRKGENPVFKTGAINIVRAMDAYHLNRYIVLTGLTLDLPTDKKGFRSRVRSLAMKLLFKDIILDKQEEFKILESSSINWTVVRVPFIEVSDEIKTTDVSLVDCRGSSISSASLAEFIVEQIDSQKYLRKAPFIWST